MRFILGAMKDMLEIPCHRRMRRTGGVEKKAMLASIGSGSAGVTARRPQGVAGVMRVL
jgi:hypothetical protein